MVLAMAVLAGCASEQAADPALAATSANTTQGADLAAENSISGTDSDELICRREVVTGTNFRRRVCMTRAERDTRREESQEEMLERRSAVRGL